MPKEPRKRADGTELSTHQIRYQRVGDLIPWDKNPREHNPEGTRFLADAITKRGFLVPILVNDQGVIIAGHGRRLAALKLGGEDYEVPTIVFQEIPVDSPEFVAMAVADNQLAKNSEWSLSLLFENLDKLRSNPVHDLPSLGFNLESMNDLKTKFGKLMDEGTAAPKPPKENYRFTVECNSEQERQRLMAQVSQDGHKVKAR